MTSETLIETLRSFPDQLERLHAVFPWNARDWKPDSWDGIPSEMLSAHEQVCHVRDIEVIGYHERLRRTLQEHEPALPSLDTYALVSERAYANADPQVMLAEFRVARAATVALIESLDTAQWQRRAQFEGYGPVTLQSLVHFLVSHDQQHLAGMHWLLGKISAAAPSAAIPQ